MSFLTSSLCASCTALSHSLLLFLSSLCASWHGSSLILCAACSASGQRSKRVHSKAPVSLIDNSCAFGPRKASKVEKTIQQRSEFFVSLVPNASTSSLAHALVRSLHTCMCVYYSVSTQLWVAATLLLLPGAGTHDSDRHLGLNVVTYEHRYTNERIESETLHSTGSLEDPL